MVYSPVSYILINKTKPESNSGPKTNPRIPNIGNPSSIPIMEITGCVSAIFLLIIKRITLSIFETKIPPHSSIPIPPNELPLEISKIPAGINTMGEPMTGKKDKKRQITPQNKGSGMLNSQNPIPNKNPWVNAINPWPKTFE